MSWISNLLVLFLFFVLLVMLLDLLRKRIRRHYSNAGGILYRKLCDEEVLEKEN